MKTIDEKSWLVIRHSFNKNKYGYKVKEGDFIKIGKVIFKIKESKVSNRLTVMKITQLKEKHDESDNQLALVDNQQHNVFAEFNSNDKLKKIKKRTMLPQCRICLSEDNESDNPLLSPCKCIGGCRYVHKFCLQTWLKSKITTKVYNFLIIHSFKSLECEICRQTYPEKVKYKNEIIDLIELHRPEENYIMLESISREKRETRYLYVIHMNDKNVIRLGRANDSDVRLTDISVSRNHAYLKLINNEFYLEDNESKFGTLVLIQKDILLFPYKVLSVQSGRMFVKFSLNKTCLALLKCFNNKFFVNNNFFNDYLDQQQDEIKKDDDLISVDYVFLILFKKI